MKLARLLTVALLLALAACDGGGGGGGGEEEPPPETPTCTPGRFTSTDDNALGEYTYILGTPCPEDPAAVLPAVIVFHGMPSDGPRVQRDSNLDVLAAEEGFLTVYPTSPTRNWDAAASGGDLEFVSELIDELAAEWQADPARIYVAGHSNGGDMSLAVGANLGDKVAGVAPVTPSGTGEVYDAVAQLASPLPLVAFTGDRDTRFRSAGQEGLDIWLGNGDCDSTGTQSGDGYEVESFTCAGGTPAAIYRVDGGHTWFGSPDRPEELWASRALWDFFTSQV